MTAELTEIRFYGHLRGRFGRSIRLDVASPGEAVRALCTVVKGFRKYLTENSAPGYRVVIGKTPIAADGELHNPSGRQIIKFVPAVAGKAGIGKILAGVALVALAFVPGVGEIAIAGFTASGIAMNVGLSMILGGISQMLAGNPASPGPANPADSLPSYAFNGAVNTTAQGNPVPICYGRLRVGSQVVSTGLEAASL